MVAFQPPPVLAGGLVLVPTQGPFVVRGGGRLLARPIRVQTRYARQVAAGSGERFFGGGAALGGAGAYRARFTAAFTSRSMTRAHAAHA